MDLQTYKWNWLRCMIVEAAFIRRQFSWACGRICEGTEQIRILISFLLCKMRIVILL